MQESFLHYIWQFQYFDKKDLRTTAGEEVMVQHPGVLNTHAGPDFSQAKLRIDGIQWVGTAEIHINASDWNQHSHARDKAYDNVVLHVVWHNDQPVLRSDGTAIPTLELRGRVDEALLLKYHKLMGSGMPIACARSFDAVPDLVKLSMVEKSVVQRLEKKATEVAHLLQQNKGDWEETTYQLLARNFGFKVNSDPFFQLARSLPYRLLLKHVSHPLQVEALLFGQAGMLGKEAIRDAYYLDLQREYKVLSTKYQLASSQLKVSQWRFLRMRPANFPTLRLAQFAAIVNARPHLFSLMKESEEPATLRSFFRASLSEYWHQHYRFGMEARGPVAALGAESQNNLLINTVAPVLVAYGQQQDDARFTERAVALLQALEAERNQIIKNWEALGWRPAHAFDTQGLIELFNSLCSQRQCLQCNIGSHLIRPVL